MMPRSTSLRITLVCPFARLPRLFAEIAHKHQNWLLNPVHPGGSLYTVVLVEKNNRAIVSSGTKLKCWSGCR